MVGRRKTKRKILILKFDIEKSVGRNSAGVFSQKTFLPEKIPAYCKKAISESEENSDGKQKYYEKNKESKKKLSTH